LLILIISVLPIRSLSRGSVEIKSAQILSAVLTQFNEHKPRRLSWEKLRRFTKQQIRSIMATVNIYLTFNGRCEEAFLFYRSVFGGEFPYIGRFRDMPQDSEKQPSMNEADGNRIMHVTLPISKETCLMGSDTGGEWASSYKEGNNYSISIKAESREEADKLFNGLSAGGQTTMPMNKTFWGSYFGMFTDKFGINWMVSFDEQPMK
jgi:PhnB protein